LLNFKLLICDFDNTLYDWVEYYVDSFYSMVEVALPIVGCDRETLLDDIRSIHRKYHDSEHPFSLLEAACVKQRFPNLSREERAAALDPAFHAFNRSRINSLKLFPLVKDTLASIQRSGIKIVGHTEAKYLSVVDRVGRLELTNYFEKIYCRERSESSHPKGEFFKDWASRSLSDKVVELENHKTKPSAEVLREICEREGYDVSDALYVGDSLPKDIYMANQAKVASAWAKYGTASSTANYEKLVRVSHWTAIDVKRERAYVQQALDTTPTFTLDEGFFEITSIISEYAA